MSKKTIDNNPKKPSARQRILDTAERLFYAEGIRAVGIDRIIAEADIAKMTLYNHFPSKDDLILEVLKEKDTKVFEMFERSISRQVRRGKNRVDAFFSALKDWFNDSNYRGCSFINASVELADPNHAAAKISTQHKKRFHDMIKRIIADQHGQKIANAVAPAVRLLVEGAIVTAVTENSSMPAQTAKKAAKALISNFL